MDNLERNWNFIVIGFCILLVGIFMNSIPAFVIGFDMFFAFMINDIFFCNQNIQNKKDEDL